MDGGSLHEAVVSARFSDGTRAAVPLSIVKAIDPEAVEVTGPVDGPEFEICLPDEGGVGRIFENQFGLPSGAVEHHRIQL